MASYDGSVRINTSIDTQGVRRGVSNIRGQLTSLEGTVRKIGSVIAAAFAFTKLIQFGREAIQLGSDLQEVQNVVDVTFTTMSEKVNEFAKNADVAAGLSETMAKQYVGTFGAMSKSFGFTEKDAYEMSTALTQLSGDVASFYNISQDLAYIKLKSVFTGETETLKDLGVVMTQAALDQYALANGFGKTTGQMTEQEKVALRYQFVMQKLAGASGDFVRTADGWANQVRVLKLKFDSLKATVGQGLINIFTPVIRVINILLGKLATLASAFKAFTELITGKKTSSGSFGGISAGGASETAEGYNQAADAAENLSGATDKAAKATKAAKKAAEGYLSPLDEINKMSKQDASGSGGAGGAVGGAEIDYGNLAEGESVIEETDSALSKIIEKLKEIYEISRQGFFDGLGDWQYRWESIKDSISSIKESLKDIFTDPAVFSSADNFAKSVSYMFGALAGSVASIGLTIGTNLIGGISLYLEQNKDRIKKFLVLMFDIGTEVSDILSKLFISISYVFEAFASEDGQQLTANLIGIFEDAFMGSLELAAKIGRDILNCFVQPFVDNTEGFRTALEGFLGVLSDVSGTIKDGVDQTFDKLNEIYDEHFKPFFDSVSGGLSELLAQYLEFWNGNVQPILEEWASDFDVLWDEHIQPFLTQASEYFGVFSDLLNVLWTNILHPLISWIIENVLPTVLPVLKTIGKTMANVFGNIFDILSGFLTVAQGVITFLTGVFSGDWQKAFEGIATIVCGKMQIIQGIIGTVLSFVSGIVITSMNTVLSAFKIAFNAVSSVVSTVFNFIKTIIRTSMDGIKNGITNGLNIIQSTWDRIWNSLSNTVSRITKSIKETIKDVIDWIGGKIKGLSDVFGGIGDKIGGLFGGKSASAKASSFSLSYGPGLSSPVPQALASLADKEFPGYATGTVIPRTMQKHLAWLGDNNQETEVVSPISTIEDAVVNGIQRAGGIGSDRPIVLKLYMDSKQVYEAMVRQNQIQQMATGRNRLLME